MSLSISLYNLTDLRNQDCAKGGMAISHEKLSWDPSQGNYYGTLTLFGNSCLRFWVCKV